MSRVVLLDTGPLGLLTNPKPTQDNLACTRWLQSLSNQGVRILVPEIVDYELRRELLRVNKANGIARLEAVIAQAEYLPITTSAMRQAAAFWAQARQQGQPTAGDKTIDGDVILAAQAATLGVPDAIIATTNVGHLSRFATADLWQNVSAD
jgi:predicted nucleic acid-binding protein